MLDDDFDDPVVHDMFLTLGPTGRNRDSLKIESMRTLYSAFSREVQRILNTDPRVCNPTSGNGRARSKLRWHVNVYSPLDLHEAHYELHSCQWLVGCGDLDVLCVPDEQFAKLERQRIIANARKGTASEAKAGNLILSAWCTAPRRLCTDASACAVRGRAA